MSSKGITKQIEDPQINDIVDKTNKINLNTSKGEIEDSSSANQTEVIKRSSTTNTDGKQIPVQKTPSYQYKKSVPSPIYDYFGGQQYFDSLQKTDDNMINQTHYPLKSGTSGYSPMKNKNGQTPNYNEFNLFNKGETPTEDQDSYSPNENNSTPLIMQYQQLDNMGGNKGDASRFRNQMKNIKQDNPMNMFNYHTEGNNPNMFFDNPNFNLNSNFNPMNPNFLQKSMQMFNNPNINTFNANLPPNSFMNNPMNRSTQQSTPFPGFDTPMANQMMFPMNNGSQRPNIPPELYLFEKFGKRGWQCEKCNNFNFERKYINITI